MGLEIKICGLKTADTVDRVVALGATHVGFIFFPEESRAILSLRMPESWLTEFAVAPRSSRFRLMQTMTSWMKSLTL